jgi:hypothetical protein
LVKKKRSSRGISENGKSGLKRDTALKVPRHSEIAGYLHKFSFHLWAVLSAWEPYRTRQKNKIDSVCALDPVSYKIQVIYYNYFRIALKSVLLTETKQSYEEIRT